MGIAWRDGSEQALHFVELDASARVFEPSVGSYELLHIAAKRGH